MTWNQFGVSVSFELTLMQKFTYFSTGFLEIAKFSCNLYSMSSIWEFVSSSLLGVILWELEMISGLLVSSMLVTDAIPLLSDCPYIVFLWKWLLMFCFANYTVFCGVWDKIIDALNESDDGLVVDLVNIISEPNMPCYWLSWLFFICYTCCINYQASCIFSSLY